MNHAASEAMLEEEVDALVGKSGASKPKIMKIIEETVCEKYAWALITGKRPTRQAFDPYYTQKHELAKRKLIQRLCSELQKVGKLATVRNEATSDFGRFDVLIVESNPLRILSNHGLEIVVEIKTGLSLNLAQIERYLSSGRTIILLRIPTEQTVTLRPSNCQQFLAESSQDRLDVINRLLNHCALQIPGEECSRCPVLDCSHNQWKETHQDSSVITPKDFGTDLSNFLDRLYPCINKAVRAILSELDACLTATSASRQLASGKPLAQPVLSSQALSQP